MFYDVFDSPVEQVEITESYLHFAEWAESGNVSYDDWYHNTSGGYRNGAVIY